MDNNDLKKQLDGLFSDLKELNTSEALLDKAQHDATYRLERLFSDPQEPAPPQKRAPAERTNQPARPRRKKPAPAKKIAAKPVEPVIAEDTPQAIESRLLQLLKSKNVQNRRLALEYLANTQSQSAVKPLLQAITDGDPEIAGLALSALLQINDIVKHRLMALTRQSVPPQLQRGSEVYLSHLLSQPFVYIPAEPFLMGSHPGTDEYADENEQPQHAIHLRGYWLARYPVTAAQFKVFIKKTGYRTRGDGYSNQPDNHPTVDVTWHDALAYCGWLRERTGLSVTLPSEAEWEKAARGTDGRRYPWGNEEPTDELCNFAESTPVGHYSPQGDSPYGCADMAGNVWEWTRSAYLPYPYDHQDGRENLEGDELRAVRGLTFNNAQRFTRCAFRYKLAPTLHLRHLGFRVAVSPGFE